MSELTFTGERLHEDAPLFRVDLERHRAAYCVAASMAGEGRVLDVGCGTGYGSAQLAESSSRVFGFDRVPPLRASRRSAARFLRGDVHHVPLAPQSFDLVVSFQVIEHLVDPGPYLEAIASVMRPDGKAVITTPNLLQSDRENPFHVHEYEGEELRTVLLRYFEDVELKGVGATPPVARYHDERLKQIRRITRLDPLRLRQRLPRAFIDRAFGFLSIVVRRGIQRAEELPDVTVDDFPIGPADERCLDLLAVCGRPKAR